MNYSSYKMAELAMLILLSCLSAEGAVEVKCGGGSLSLPCIGVNISKVLNIMPPSDIGSFMATRTDGRI